MSDRSADCSKPSPCRVRSWCAPLLIALAIGCQSFAPTAMTLPPETVPSETTPPVKEATKVDPELVDQFAAWLDQEAWQIDLQWSALAIEPARPIPSRYVFMPSPKAASKSKDATAANGDNAELAAISRWNAVWRGDAERLEPAEHQAILSVLDELRSRYGKIGANATILQARLLRGPHDLAEKTAALARVAAGQYDAPATGTSITKAPTLTRAVAAEVWCELLRKSSTDAVTALTPAGELLQRPGLPDELRTALWRSLAVSIPPDHLPQLSTTLARKWDDTPTGEILKRAALEACILHAVTHADDSTTWDAALWPPQIEALRYDRDPKSRQLFGRWVALAQHPQAAAWLAAQLRDTEPMIRESALQSLGRLSTDSARDELLKSAQRETGRPRALAVHALASHSVQDVLRFARDPSADVRAAVARSLVNHPSEESAIALRPCLSDPNTDVAAAALMTTQAWPVNLRLPLLLDAVRAGSLSTRQSAVFALREVITDLPDLPVDGTPDEREAAIRLVAQQQQIRLDIWTLPAEQSRPREDQSGDDDVRVAAIQATLQQYLEAALQSAAAAEAWDRLVLSVTVADLDFLERKLLEVDGKPAAETVRRELLPRVSPAYAALVDLESTEVLHRRRGARALLASTDQLPLTSGVLIRLREILTYEQDQQVWHSCLAALQPDAHADAAPIVLLAIHQMWPDIRRLGLDVVARHPTPEAATWLLPLLTDSQRSVRLAAVRTIAACGNPVAIDGLPAANGTAAIPGLRNLMTDNDEELRHAAIVSAATLHDELALQELTRLGHHTTPSTRDFAVQAMARTGQTRYVDTLIRMAWTETADPVKLSILRSLDSLVPEDRRPRELSGLVANGSIDDKIKVWARWGDDQRRRTMSAPPTEARSRDEPVIR